MTTKTLKRYKQTYLFTYIRQMNLYILTWKVRYLIQHLDIRTTCRPKREKGSNLLENPVKWNINIQCWETSSIEAGIKYCGTKVMFMTIKWLCWNTYTARILITAHKLDMKGSRPERYWTTPILNKTWHGKERTKHKYSSTERRSVVKLMYKPQLI